MGWPKARRLLPYSMALPRAMRAPPVTPAPSLKRPTFRMLKAILWPLPISPEEVLLGDLGVGEDQGPGGAALDAGLLLLGAQGDPGRALLDDEGREVLAVHLGEGDVDVGEAGVREPHLLAVQDPVLAVGREHRLGLGVHGVAGRAGLGERVRADPLAGGELGQVLLLLGLGAEVDDGQGADAGVPHEGHGEGAVAGRLLGDQAARDLVEAEAAVLLGHLDAQQAQLARLAQELAGGLVLEGEDLGKARHHLLLHELFRGLADHPLLFGEVLGGEDLVEATVLDEEAAALGGDDGNLGFGGHLAFLP